jgi:hypothetical protein
MKTMRHNRKGCVGQKAIMMMMHTPHSSCIVGMTRIIRLLVLIAAVCCCFFTGTCSSQDEDAMSTCDGAKSHHHGASCGTHYDDDDDDSDDVYHGLELAYDTHTVQAEGRVHDTTHTYICICAYMRLWYKRDHEPWFCSTHMTLAYDTGPTAQAEGR